MMRRGNRICHIVFLPPPCSNGDLHLGHIAGVYLPADIFSRVLKIIESNAEVITIAGADENNTYTLKKSIQINKTIHDTCELYSNRIQLSLKYLEINPDLFIRTSSQIHKKVSNGIFDKLKENKHVVYQDTRQLYSKTRQQFVSDSFCKGYCYICASETDAGTCENCGELIDHKKLLKPIYYSDTESLELQPTKAYSIKLGENRNLFTKDFKKQKWNTWIKKKALQWVSSNKNTFLELTKIFSEGLQIQNSKLNFLSIPLWFEAVWVYYTGIYLFFQFESFEKFYAELKNKSINIYYFMGVDNRFHFSISDSIVRILLGFKKIYTRMYIKPFLNINGKKFSTSRGRAIFIGELKEILNPYFLRFSLYQIHCSSKNNFTLHLYFETIKKYKGIVDFLIQYNVIENSFKTIDNNESLKKCLYPIRKDIKNSKPVSLSKIFNKIESEIRTAKNDNDLFSGCYKYISLLECVLPNISQNKDLKITIPTLRQNINFIKLFNKKSIL
ncbi:tRNA ligase [Leptospira levettii]|nr:tRNA ligase [Leptospira levettii]